MPGKPDIKEQMLPTPAGPIKLHLFIVERKRENTAFLLGYNDYPPDAIALDPEDQFDAVQQGAVANVKGRVLNSRKISLGPIPGREAELEMPGAGIMIVRYYLSGNRFYQVGMFRVRSVRPDSPDVKKLFDSFKILR